MILLGLTDATYLKFLLLKNLIVRTNINSGSHKFYADQANNFSMLSKKVSPVTPLRFTLKRGELKIFEGGNVVLCRSPVLKNATTH